MIAVIILGFIVIAIVASAGYAMMGIMHQTQDLMAAQQERQILDRAEITLVSRLRPIGVNQILVPPVGVYGEKYQELDKDLGVRTTNAWDIELVYCPLGHPISAESNGFPSKNIKVTDESEYSARYVTDNNDNEYVFQSSFVRDSSYSDHDVLAFIISRKPSSNPNCADVIYKNGRYELERIVDGSNVPLGGIVRAITKESVINYRANQSITESPRDYSVVQTLNDLSESWIMRPRRLTIDLEDTSAINMTANIEIESGSFSGKSEYRILGDSDTGTAIQNVDDQQIELNFENVEVYMKDVSLADGISLNFKSSSLVTDNVSIGKSISMEDSTWVIKGNTSAENSLGGTAISLINSSLTQQQSTLSVSTNAASGSAVILLGSEWHSNNSTANITLSSIATNAVYLGQSSRHINHSSLMNIASTSISGAELIYVDESSRITLNNGRINSADTNEVLIVVEGELITSNGSQITNTGALVSAVSVLNGGRLTLEDTNIGSNARNIAVPIDAPGAGSIAGSGTQIYGAVCWQGPIFESNQTPITGTSEANDPVYKILNQSNWNCN